MKGIQSHIIMVKAQRESNILQWMSWFLKVMVKCYWAA